MKCFYAVPYVHRFQHFEKLLLFVVVTAALYWKKRIRPLRILFAIALCFWLFCGFSVLMIWK